MAGSVGSSPTGPAVRSENDPRPTNVQILTPCNPRRDLIFGARLCLWIMAGREFVRHVLPGRRPLPGVGDGRGLTVLAVRPILASLDPDLDVFADRQGRQDRRPS